MPSDREMTKIKVVNLLELYNFVVDNFFIWIHLESQILILKLDNVNTRGMLCPLVTNDFEVELLALICMKPEVAGLNPHSCSRVVVVTVHELYPVLSHIYSYLKETIKICMKKCTINTYGYMMQDACSWKIWWSNNVLFKEKQKREISLQYKRVAVCQCPDELFTQTQLQADFLFSFVSSRWTVRFVESQILYGHASLCLMHPYIFLI